MKLKLKFATTTTFGYFYLFILHACTALWSVTIE